MTSRSKPTRPRPFAQPGADLPLAAVFRVLKDRWQSAHNNASNVDVAGRLGCTRQAITNWTNGTDPTKRPPFWALIALADDLKLELRVSGVGIEIARRGRAASDHPPPAG